MLVNKRRCGGLSRERRGAFAQNWRTNLVQSLSINEKPTNFYDLGRVLGNVDAVLVTGCGHVDHDIPVEFLTVGLTDRCHGNHFGGGKSSDLNLGEREGQA